MLHLDIGLSALRANQTALNTISNNIANANTVGYHRQQVTFADRNPQTVDGHSIGTGVSVSRITRARSALIEQSLSRQMSDQSYISVRGETLDQLENLLLPGETSIDGRLQNFFNAWEELSARPTDAVHRRQVLEAASGLAEEFNAVARGLDSISRSLDESTNISVDEINQLVSQIAGINGRISEARSLGDEPNDLLDQRDQLINSLSQQIDVTRIQQGGELVGLSLASGRINFFRSPVELTATPTSSEGLIVSLGDTIIPPEQLGGRLGGLLESRHRHLADVREQLSELTAAFVTQVDQLHATGIGLDGGFQQTTGVRGVSDITLPLAESAPLLASSTGPATGGLFIAVTETATGVRRLHEVSLDTQTDSLVDLAANLSAIPNLVADVNAADGTLRIVSLPGYEFDFTGRQETNPDVTSITGTSRPKLFGNFIGAENDVWTLTALSGGTVGVTPGMQVEVRDQNGSLITRLDVGADYEPGSVISIADGVDIAFTSGTFNTGDELVTPVVADSDPVGILSALGLRSLFEGRFPGEINVRPALLSNPRELSVAATFALTDGLLAADFGELRDSTAFGESGMTFEEFATDMVVRVADEARDARQQADTIEVSLLSLTQQQQSVAGVDPNEELILMLQYQRSFQAAARFLSGVEESLDQLFQIV